MRSLTISYPKTVLVIAVLMAIIAIACNSSEAKNEETENPPPLTQKQLIEKGDYLVNTIGGCGDCHSPKIFNAQGFEFDKSRHLSGHPANDPLPPLNGSDPFKPGNWVLFSPDLTAAVGPWGVTFSANLTPHSTGIGGWKLENFIGALRTGKHMGVQDGRPIMPPMPWPTIGQLNDDDLKAIFTYLQSLPPIDNMVPAPIGPEDARKMLK